jgi:hypothetical protein
MHFLKYEISAKLFIFTKRNTFAIARNLYLFSGTVMVMMINAKPLSPGMKLVGCYMPRPSRIR